MQGTLRSAQSDRTTDIVMKNRYRGLLKKPVKPETLKPSRKALRKIAVISSAWLISTSKRDGQKRPAGKEQDKGLAHVFDDFANLFHSCFLLAMPPPYRKVGAGQELFSRPIAAPPF